MAMMTTLIRPRLPASSAKRGDVDGENEKGKREGARGERRRDDENVRVRASASEEGERRERQKPTEKYAPASKCQLFFVSCAFFTINLRFQPT